jgi:hypothetical protein
MKKRQAVAADPELYVAALSGWQRAIVEALRTAVLGASPVAERIKWTNIVFFANGPLAMIRAEEGRVLFGFWRGQRLRELEPGLKPGGQYEMATMTIRDGDAVDPAAVARLVRAAVELNETLGDPSSPT